MRMTRCPKSRKRLGLALAGRVRVVHAARII
jgi:hypothetical protein